MDSLIFPIRKKVLQTYGDETMEFVAGGAIVIVFVIGLFVVTYIRR